MFSSIIHGASTLSDPQPDLQSTVITRVPDKFNALTTSFSAGLKRLYFKNNALSMFMDPSYYGEVVSRGLRTEECIAEFKYGHRDDPDHRSWHKSENDFEISHSHIISANNEKMQPAELQCILDNIIRFDKGQKYYHKLYNISYAPSSTETTRLDPEKVALTVEDRNYILEKYTEFYNYKGTSEQEEKLAAEVTQQLDILNESITIRRSDINKSLDEIGKSVFQAFFSTLLNHYLKPYFISKSSFKPANITWACDIVNSACKLALTQSPMQTGFSYVLEKAIKSALLKLGIDLTTTEALVTNLGTITAITENPSQLIQLGLNSCAASVGQNAAYAIIRQLPKLKEEPAVEKSSGTSVEVNTTNGLRKRSH